MLKLEGRREITRLGQFAEVPRATELVCSHQEWRGDPVSWKAMEGGVDSG